MNRSVFVFEEGINIRTALIVCLERILVEGPSRIENYARSYTIHVVSANL